MNRYPHPIIEILDGRFSAISAIWRGIDPLAQARGPLLNGRLRHEWVGGNSAGRQSPPPRVDGQS
jgi:hypothetical protein